MVPEEVRRLFQVLTGEDMTDADEDALFAVAGRLESDAATVESLAPVVGNVVERVRGGFSGKAADRFAQRLAAFGPVLEAGAVGVRQLAEFVRNLALQVQYLKFVTVGGLLLLVAEIAWAVAMAGPTGGASMAWLAARFAVMRLLLTRWWGQLFMRLAMSQVVGIGLQVVMDAGAQGLQFALGTRKKWDAAMSEMAVGVGSFSGLLAVPLSALGNVVGNAIAKVLVRGLGDKIDAEVLAAAARQVAEEHAEQYPVASMARFADVVSKNLEDYTGMSVRAMWVARFGHGLGESLEEGLTEMLGEAGYGAISGQGAQWNPFSFTAGVSEAIGSGIGNLAGLAVRGELIPAGRAREDTVGEKDSASTDTDTAGELQAESGAQAGEKPGFAETFSEKPGSAKEMSDVDSGIPAPGSEKVVATELEKGSVGPGVAVTSAVLPDGLAPGKTSPGDSSGAAHQTSVPDAGIATPAGADPSGGPGQVGAGAVAGEDSETGVPGTTVVPPVPRYPGEAGAPGALPGPGRLGTPPPLYSSHQGQDHVHGEAPDTGEPTGFSRAATSPPPYSQATGDTGPAPSDVDGVDGPAGHSAPSSPSSPSGPESVPGLGSVSQGGTPVSAGGAAAGDFRTDTGSSGVDSESDSDGRARSPAADGGVAAGGFRAGAPPMHGPAAGSGHADAGGAGAGSAGASVQHPAPVPGAGSSGPGGSLVSDGELTRGESGTGSPPRSEHTDTGLSSVDRPSAGVRAVEPTESAHGPLVDKPATGADVPGVSSGGVVPETTSLVAGSVAATDGQESTRGGGGISGASAGAGLVAGSADPARGGTPHSPISPQSPQSPQSSISPQSPVQPGPVSPGGRLPVAAPVGLPADAVRVPVPAEVVTGGGVAEFVRGQVGDAEADLIVLAPGEGSGSGVAISPGQATEVALGLGRDVVALVPGRGRRGPRWMRFGSDGTRPRPVGRPGPVVAPEQTGRGRDELSALTGSSATVPASAAEVAPRPAGQERGAETVPAVAEAQATATGPKEETRGHTQDEPTARPSVPAVLAVRGSDESVTYPEWTRSPGYAEAAPDRERLLVVLGGDRAAVSGDSVAQARRSGADVLARTGTAGGPQWMLFRADGREPQPVEPPAEIARFATPEPLLVFGPDDGAVAAEAAALASDMPGVQVVGMHVTPQGGARWPDGVVDPEESANRIRRDRRFVAGLPVALFGCGAGRRSRPVAASFAQRFATGLRAQLWTTEASGVWQTDDGAVHATETTVTADGRMLPVFVDGQGTGQWSLLGPDGQELRTHGPELRAALTGAAQPRYADHTRPEPVIRWADDEDVALTDADEGGTRGNELLSGWWDATDREDAAAFVRRRLSDEDVRRLADEVELRYRDGVGGPGTRSGQRLRGRLVHLLQLTEELGGRPDVAQARDVRLVADWIRDVGRMRGPTVFPADVHGLLQELTGTTTNARLHEVRFLADVVRRAEEGLEQRRATVDEVREQWRRGATRAVTLRMGGQAENTVVYPVSMASSRWWRDFHGGRVQMDQVRREMGIPGDRDPMVVVVEARRRTAGAEKSFLIGDAVRGSTAHLETPWELGQGVAGTEQYQRIAGNNADSPVVLVVLGGNAGLGVHLSRDELARRFAAGLSAGGDGVRQVLLAEGYISHDPAGFGLAAVGPPTGARQDPGVVLPSGVRPNVLALRLRSAPGHTIAYPADATTEGRLLSAAREGSGRQAIDAGSPISVLTWIAPWGGFIVADRHTWETQEVTPREFARWVVEDARSHGIVGHDDDRPVVVRTFLRERVQTLPAAARRELFRQHERIWHELAEGFREAGYHGPIHVTSLDRATHGPEADLVVPWSPQLRLTIRNGVDVIDAVAYPRDSAEEAAWRRWAQSAGPGLDWLLAQMGYEPPILVLACRADRDTFAYVDPETRETSRLSAGAFGRIVAGAVGEIAASNPSKTVVVFAVRPDSGGALREQERRQLASGIHRYGHEGPVYVASVVERHVGENIRFVPWGITLAGGHPHAAELQVRLVGQHSRSEHIVLAAGGTSADVNWWSQWNSGDFQVNVRQRFGLQETNVVLARLWGDEFVTPSGTVSAFEFGRRLALNANYNDYIVDIAPVLLATFGAETGLGEHAAREFARGVWSNDPDREVWVTDRDFRVRRDADDVAVIPLDTDPPRFVPSRNWSPVARLSRPADDDFGPVLVYPYRPGWAPPLAVDMDWFVSEAGHRRPVVVVARSVRGRFHVVDPSTDETRVLGPSDFGTSVLRNEEFQQSVSDDPARPVVVVFDWWPSGLTEGEARALAEGLRGDGIRRPVFLSMGQFRVHESGRRPYALVEAPSAQSALLTHPASAVDAQRPLLLSYVDDSDAGVADQVRSFGVSRLLSELGYRGPQQPIVILTSTISGSFLASASGLSPANFGEFLAAEPKYLEATRGDWRRPVVIVPLGGRFDSVSVEDLTPFTARLLGTPDADRPVYISHDNIPADGLAMLEDGVVALPGLRLLTPDRMQLPRMREELESQPLRVGVAEESALNAVGFPVEPEDAGHWEQWGSLNFAGYGPMLRRAVSEFDPDPLFVFVKVSGERIVVMAHDSDSEPEPEFEAAYAPEAGRRRESPDPVEVGMLIQHSPYFQDLEYPFSDPVDAGQLGRTVVIVPMSYGESLPDWYERALAEGLRRVGGPPRPVYVYDGYRHEAFGIDDVLDRLRNVTPELHWRRAGEVRDLEEHRELVPRYERDSPPSYASAGEVASAVAAVDRRRAAAVPGAPARPAEVTETEIATLHQRWSGEFREAERVLSALPADGVADLQARAGTILESLWERPRQGDTSSAMAMQALWDRMAQRIAFRLSGDASETRAWAEAAAMAASVPSLPVVLAVRGSDESVVYPEWTRSPGYAAVSPEQGRLLVLGSDRVVVPGESVAEARRSGVDVLARTDTEGGPQWILLRADGGTPFRVEPSAEVGRLPSPAPLMFFADDEGGVAVEAAALAADVPGVQVVGLHVTPEGGARWPDGELSPEESAERVWRDQRFVAGLPVALFGCGAGRRSGSGEPSFAQRFAARLRAQVWTADASDVWQTRDGAVHATESVVSGDGRMLPVFVDGQGTGQWSLLGPDGQEVFSRGPELRAALTDSAAPRYAEGASQEALIRWADDADAAPAAGGRPIDELLREWRAARGQEDGELAAGRGLADEDVWRVADAVELRYRSGVGQRPGTRSWERLRVRLVHVLRLTEQLGGQPTVADARDVRLVADWIRDTGRMQGPMVTAADVHGVVQELTDDPRNVRFHEARYLAGVLRDQGVEGRRERQASVAELRAQWRRGATRAVTLRMGGHAENTVAYPVSMASSRWWRDFHGGRVDLDRVRREMGIAGDRDPVVVVVEARRRTAGAEKSFLIGDAVRGTTAHLETPWELGQWVAGTEQYQRIAGSNQDGPVVLVVTGGNAGLGVHLSRDELTRRFAEGLTAGGDGSRQVLLAEGYISQDPSGFGLIAVDSGTGRAQDAGLMLPSGVGASVLALRMDSAHENTIAYPVNAENRDDFRALAGSDSLRMDSVRQAVEADSPIFVLAWTTPQGVFIVADEDTGEMRDLTPREFARQMIEDARSHGIASRYDDRAVVVFTYASTYRVPMPNQAREELAKAMRDAGHRGPVHVATWDSATNGPRLGPESEPVLDQSFELVDPWSPRSWLAIPAESGVIDVVAYPKDSAEAATWRRWAESGPDLDWLPAQARDDGAPVFVLAGQESDGMFVYVDPATRQTGWLSPGAFGREVAGALGEITTSNPGKAVVVLAVQQDVGTAMSEQEGWRLASGIRRNGHDGPLYIANVEDNQDTWLAVKDIALAGGLPRVAELSVSELNSANPSHVLLAAGGTSADVDWWYRWSSGGFRVTAARWVGLGSTTVALARLWGEEFVTPSGTVSAFEFGRQLVLSSNYGISALRPGVPVLLATVGAESGLGADAASEFARGVWSNDPDRTVLVTDRDFRLRRDANGAAVLHFDEDPPRFVPSRNWSPMAARIRAGDEDFGPVVTYPSRPGPVPRLSVDMDWVASETGRGKSFVVVARSVRGRFHVLDQTGETRVLAPSDFGSCVIGNAGFPHFFRDDPNRPVVVVFDRWPSGLTERDARALAEGLRRDGVQRPVFLSMGEFAERESGWRSHALVEAPSAQSVMLRHPAGAAGAQRPLLISYLDPSEADVADQIRSFGVSRLVSELGYRDPQQPIVVLASAGGSSFFRGGVLSPARFGDLLAADPEYLAATRGDWRRPVVIISLARRDDVRLAGMADLTPFTSHLLGSPDADRPVYIPEDNVTPAMLEGGTVGLPGLRLLTPDRMRPPAVRDELKPEYLKVGGVSTPNGVCFPVQPEELGAWASWSSLDYQGCGPMLRRAVGEFDPDPLFVFVKVVDQQIEVIRHLADESGAESDSGSRAEGGFRRESPDPVELGMLIQRSSAFQVLENSASRIADAGQLGRTVVLVADSLDNVPLPNWYTRALAEGLRRVGGPPRAVYVYDGFSHEAADTDAALDRLRSATPELHWRRAGDARNPEEPREIVPPYERDLPPDYHSAGEVASAVASVDRQREVAGVARPALPAEVTEAEIASVHRHWSGQFEEAERVLSALPADGVADLQARARAVLGSMWERPRQGDTPSAMAVQDLWDRMAQRVAFRLSGEGAETGAWAEAAAMAASVPSLPVVLAVRGSDESVVYPEWTRSPGYAQVSPDRGQVLVVQGSDSMIVTGESVAEAQRSGADVLARMDTEDGPQWMVFRVGGGVPLRVEPPAEVARSASPVPLLAFGPDEDAVAAEAVALASDLPGVQVVGVHVTPEGGARWPDGELGPEESAERVWRDRRFVAGLPVALFGCGAGRRPGAGEASFAQRFAVGLGAYVWAAGASDVWQTRDGAVHATESVVSGDGRMLPVFVGGRGTGHWSLLGPDGQEVSSGGPELRAALAGASQPQYAEQARPETVIRWADSEAAVPGPVSLSVPGARQRAEYVGWTLSPHHAAAAPQGARPLLVLGHEETVVSGDAVAEARDIGADVLARVDLGRGPKWMLYRADGTRPRPVDPPTELSPQPVPGTVADPKVR
ncbi:WXG100-like domain-containing protein [Saccharopolyspora phatthalungensis]